MAIGWTDKRRHQQRHAIHAWKPWQRSTGPQSKSGKEASSRNAWKGGHRETLRNLARLLRGLPAASGLESVD